MAPANRSWPNRASATRHSAKRSGMTLLELILALGLAALILYAVSMAIDFHLRTLDVRRSNVEEAQVARATLQMIANDLRGTVREYPVDTSAIEQMLANSISSAMGGGAESVGLGGTGSGGAGGSQGGGGSGNSGGNGSTGGNGPGGGGTGGGGGPGNIPGPGDPSAPNDDNGGFLGGGASGGSASGNTGGGGTGSGSGTSGSSSTSEDGSTENTAELASSTQLPPTPGLYGNQYQLQIDVSRLPRPDQYQSLVSSSPLSLPQIPSDVKTVTYYVQNGTSSGTGVTDPFAYGAQATGAPAVGLVRREVDRSVVLYAQTAGTSDSLLQTGDLIAPEITSIQFQYFDGFEWLPQWDSAAMKSLPVAVEILIAVTPPQKAAAASNRVGAAATTVASQPVLYRLVVQLPLGEPIEPESSETTDSGLESVGL